MPCASVTLSLPDAQKFKEAFEKAQQENKVILESTKSTAPADNEETRATEAKAEEKKEEAAAEAKAEETKA